MPFDSNPAAPCERTPTRRELARLRASQAALEAKERAQAARAVRAKIYKAGRPARDAAARAAKAAKAALATPLTPGVRRYTTSQGAEVTVYAAGQKAPPPEKAKRRRRINFDASAVFGAPCQASPNMLD